MRVIISGAYVPCLASSGSTAAYHMKPHTYLCQLEHQTLGALQGGKPAGNNAFLGLRCHSPCPGKMRLFMTLLAGRALLRHRPHNGKQTVNIDTGTCHCRSRRSIWRGGRL